MLLFSYLNRINVSAFSKNLGINHIIHLSIFFEKLLIVKKIRARKQSLKESTSLKFILCFLDVVLLGITQHVVGYIWWQFHHGCRIYVLNLFCSQFSLTLGFVKTTASGNCFGTIILMVYIWLTLLFIRHYSLVHFYNTRKTQKISYTIGLHFLIKR